MKNDELSFIFMMRLRYLLMSLVVLFPFVLFLQLEDIAVIPAQLNPAVNHVECVVEEKHPGFELQRVKKTLPYICWAFWLFSITAGYFATVVFIQLFQEREKDVVKTTLTFSFIVSFVGFVFGIIAIFYGTPMKGYQMVYPSIYLSSVVLTYILGYVYYLVSLVHINRHLKRMLVHVYPSSFVMIHSILWMIVGMITEPYWAISVVTSEAVAVRLLYLLLGFFYSPARNWDIRDKINFTLLLILSMSVISVQLFYFSVSSHNEGLTFIVIPFFLIVIFPYCHSFMSKRFDSSKSQKGKDEACIELRHL